MPQKEDDKKKRQTARKPIDPIQAIGMAMGGQNPVSVILPQVPGAGPAPVTPMTPPFNPAAGTGVPPGAGVPPVPGQYPTQPAGTNPGSRLLSMLSDPRSRAWLLSVAQGLAQPRGVGQTGVSNAMGALASGQNTLAMAQQMQNELNRQYREEARTQEKHVSGLETEKVGRAATESAMRTDVTRAETGQKQAGIQEKSVTANIQNQINALAHRKEILDFDREKFGDLIGLDRDKFEASVAQATRTAELEKRKLDNMDASLAGTTMYQQQMAATAWARAKADLARVANLARQIELGQEVSPALWAQTKAQAMTRFAQTQAALRFGAPTPEDIREDEAALDRLDQRLESMKPTSSQRQLSPEAQALRDKYMK